MIPDKPRARVRQYINDYAVAYTFLRLRGHTREYAEEAAATLVANNINLTHGRPDLVRGRPEEGSDHDQGR